MEVVGWSNHLPTVDAHLSSVDQCQPDWMQQPTASAIAVVVDTQKSTNNNLRNGDLRRIRAHHEIRPARPCNGTPTLSSVPPHPDKCLELSDVQDKHMA